MRAMNSLDYQWAIITTIGIATAQPFLLNSGTKLAAIWFPLNQRATVIGFFSIAILLGIGIGQVATPELVIRFGFEAMLWIYGTLGAISCFFFLIFSKENPPTPSGNEERVLVRDGLRRIIKLRSFYAIVLVLFIIGGVYDGLSTWVEVIMRPKGINIGQVGIIGGALQFGGLVGVLILPPISDRNRVRKPIFRLGAFFAIPALLGITFFSNFTLLLLTSFILGFCLMGIFPILIQFATEICYPAPEGTSSGLFILAGQISVVLITALGWANQVFGSFIPPLLALAAMLSLITILLFYMKED